MNKNFRRLTALICTLLIVLGVTACSVDKTKTQEELSLKFQHAAQDREVGETQSMLTYENHYAYGIHYPAIGVESIDGEIKAAAQAIADNFVKAVTTSQPKGELPTLSADYRSYLVTDNGKNKYVSIVFEIKTDIPDENVHTDKIQTMLFDIPAGKSVSQAEFFKPGFESFVSGKVMTYFASNRLFSSEIDTDDFKNNMAAKPENFSRFAINGDSIIFYFDAGTAFKADKGCVEAVIKLSEMKSALSAEAAKVLVKSSTAEGTSSGTTSSGKSPSLPGGVKYIAFTFDDGPSKVVTNRILDTLEKYNGRATFFVLGTRVGSYSAEVKRAYAMGCEIGSHSWSHANLKKISAQERKEEINKTNAIVKEVIGVEPTLFRVPYGDYKGIQKNFDMPLIQWCIDTEDWKYKDRQGSGRTEAQRNADMQKIISSVVDHATGGEIVLMHDLYDMTADAFEQIAEQLDKAGFKFVTVGEIYELYGIELEPGVVYFGPKVK